MRRAEKQTNTAVSAELLLVFSYLFDDERVPSFRPTHDVVGYALDHSKRPVQKDRDVVVEGLPLRITRSTYYYVVPGDLLCARGRR